MKNALQFAAVTFILLLAVGGFKELWRKSHYNAQFEQNFMTACEADSSNASCACFYTKIKKNYTYQEAVQLDQRAQAGDYDSGLVALANMCR